jgi:hypothetical protein
VGRRGVCGWKSEELYYITDPLIECVVGALRIKVGIRCTRRAGGRREERERSGHLLEVRAALTKLFVKNKEKEKHRIIEKYI